MRKSLLALLLLSLLLLSACSSAGNDDAPAGTADDTTQSEDGSEAGSEGDSTSDPVAGDASLVTLDINHGTEPPSLDPSVATDSVSVDIITNMFMGLTRFNQEAEVEPWAATDWTVSEDGRTYTFNLRDDLSWVTRNADSGEISEVRPLVAQDFADGIRRTLDPNTASDYAYVLYVIDGGEAFNNAVPEAEDFQTLSDGLGVNAVDDTTLEVTFADPISYAPAIMGMWITYAQPLDVITEVGDGWTEAGSIVTSGAYTLEAWEHNVELNLIKNPYYFEADTVQIDRIVGAIITEDSTAMALYESGELDVTSPPSADLDRVRSDEVLSQELNISPQTCTYYFGFVNDKPPTDNATVRRALSAAINRPVLIDNVIKGGQIPAHSFAPPGIFGSVADDMEVGGWMVMDDYAAQVAQAQAWMEEAGYPNGEGLELLIMHNTSEAHAAIAQAVQAMWLEAFPSAFINIENQEWGVYLETIAPASPVEEKPNVYRLGWCADYPDQNNWVNDVFNSASGNNSAMFQNEAFDQLVNEASIEQDQDKRAEMYKEAEMILVDTEAAIAPIYYYTTVQLRKPWMEQVVISPSGGDAWYQWQLDWDAKREATGQ
ncbi:MAG: peptide ABC transporter substrate-binding protein [Anaerolineales bacterium]|nr:peptide ABC transporter substrate-binding protein [Anaerolineales bacterium]MCB9128583.1 peptide ABC transporter substrate-binding protein [Ardenticatenales bacterium]